ALELSDRRSRSAPAHGEAAPAGLEGEADLVAGFAGIDRPLTRQGDALLVGGFARGCERAEQRRANSNRRQDRGAGDPELGPARGGLDALVHGGPPILELGWLPGMADPAVLTGSDLVGPAQPPKGWKLGCSQRVPGDSCESDPGRNRAAPGRSEGRAGFR